MSRFIEIKCFGSIYFFSLSKSLISPSNISWAEGAGGGGTASFFFLVAFKPLIIMKSTNAMTTKEITADKKLPYFTFPRLAQQCS